MLETCETAKNPPVYYSRVYFGSSMPEFYLYDENMNYIRYWGEYHDGFLPKGLLPCPQ